MRSLLRSKLLAVIGGATTTDRRTTETSSLSIITASRLIRIKSTAATDMNASAGMGIEATESGLEAGTTSAMAETSTTATAVATRTMTAMAGTTTRKEEIATTEAIETGNSPIGMSRVATESESGLRGKGMSVPTLATGKAEEIGAMDGMSERAVATDTQSAFLIFA